jgi:CheY-like chemotaxis protein
MRPNGKRVLVIDDDEDLRFSIAALLLDEGYGTLTIEDGEPALAFLKRGPPPDVILTDLRMPLVSGWEVIETLRADPRLRKVPVLIVSGLVTPEIAQQLGAAGYLRKPIKADELFDMVAKLCGMTPRPAEASRPGL